MKKLYKFYWDCGRMGSLDGIFIADDKDVKKVIGKEVYFGEVLGKHSEIYGTLEEKDLKVITDDHDFIKKCEEYGIGNIGFNPVQTYNENNE